MLPLVYVAGWLPLLVAAVVLRAAGGAPRVLTPPAGGVAALALVASLVIVGSAYLVTVRHPPTTRSLLVSLGGALVTVAAIPVLFSADAYAYAYYGERALRGLDPWGDGPALGGALASAAVAAWDGQLPPRCVYGPLAVAVAALADLAGGPWGAAAQLTAQRAAAVAAYGAFAALALRRWREPRTRAIALLNPVAIWSAGEGHNDSLMVALVMAGLAAEAAMPARRALWLGAATLVKAPAAFVLATTVRGQAARLGWTVAVLGYVPLFLAVGRAGFGGGAATVAWQSPLGLAAAAVGRPAAIALALVWMGGCVGWARGRANADRWLAVVLAGWFCLPNAYPWYGVWIVPLAAVRPDSPWSRALLIASLVAPARAIIDVAWRTPQHVDAAGSLVPPMIALQYLPPILALAAPGLRRFAALAVVSLAALLTSGTSAANAQTIAVSPSTSSLAPRVARRRADRQPRLPSSLPGADLTACGGDIITPSPRPASVPDGPPIPHRTQP